MTIHIPDAAPPVLRPSAVWPELAGRATLEYHDTLPAFEVARSSVTVTDHVFDACPRLSLP